MKKNKVIITALSVVTLLFLTGCGNTYEKHYKSTLKTTKKADRVADYDFLKKDEEPKIFYTDEAGREDALVRLLSQYYRVLGESVFSSRGIVGDYEKQIVEYAKKVGATAVLAKNVSHGTESGTITSLVPNNINTNYSGKYGQSIGSSITTYLAPKTMAYSYEKMEYSALFLAKYNKKLRIGLRVGDLTEELRKKHKRNTGALVVIVLNDTSAFNANILRGDIIVKVDGRKVNSGKDASKLMSEVSPNAKSSVLTILRDGKEVDMVIEF